MGIFDKLRRQRTPSTTAAAPEATPPREPTADDLYLTVRAPVFRDPRGGSPAPLDPHGELIRTAFLGGDSAAGWKFRPELDLLAPWLVLDEATGETHVATDEWLDRLGVTRAEAIERARSATLLGGSVTISDGGPRDTFTVRGIWPARNAGLLVTPEVFEPWAARVPGDLLVLPACDDDIMLVGSADETLTEAVNSAIGYHQRAGHRRLSPIPYAVADNRLHPWRPPTDSRAYPAVREAEVAQRVVAYGDFTAELHRHLTSDVAAAERGVSTSTGLPFSYCTASLVGPTQYLPFVEYAGFENLEPQQNGFAWVPFDRLRHLPGATMTPAWQYGLPVIQFDPPSGADAHQELSAAVRECADDPWQ